MSRDDESDSAGDAAASPPAHLAHLDGMDLVRRTLEEARGRARAEGKDVGRGRGSAAPRRAVVAGRRRRWSGPGPDSRDPQPLAAATRDLARARGWNRRVSEGGVFAQWATVVGADIADHAVPTALRDGVLQISAESTAWATQLRMMQAQLLARIAAAVGDGVVTTLKITGPAAPPGRTGPYRVAGRGPRDTYG
jgi:predicted nucleic acid-binding Zn ribbon protein